MLDRVKDSSIFANKKKHREIMMKEQPLFSVLIANYNNGKYLMDAIDSVRQQTYANWEIILVDDSSTDNSEELYAELEKDERIHIYRNERNMGCGYTKRRCAEIANGMYCGFLDPDDALMADALQVMADAHIQCPKICAFYSRHYVADVDMNVMYVEDAQKELPRDMSFLEYGQGVVSHFVAFKVAFYRQSCGINPYLLRAVDHDLYYLLEELGPIKLIPQPLYVYRTGTSNNISLGANLHVAAMWDIIAQYEACRRRGYMNTTCENFLLRDIASIEHYVAEKEKMKVYASKTYQIGHIVLHPCRMIMRWLRIM